MNSIENLKKDRSILNNQIKDLITAFNDKYSVLLHYSCNYNQSHTVNNPKEVTYEFTSETKVVIP